MTGAASDLTLPSIQCTSGTKDAGNDMEEITVKAYGKLNLCLDVTGKREDGYHLVKMIRFAPLHPEKSRCIRTAGIFPRVRIILFSGRQIGCAGNFICRADLTLL